MSARCDPLARFGLQCIDGDLVRWYRDQDGSEGYVIVRPCTACTCGLIEPDEPVFEAGEERT